MRGVEVANVTGRRLAVRFLRRWQTYFAGDVATFPARMSQGLVNRGIAEAVNIHRVPENEIPEGAALALRMPAEPPYRNRAEDDIPDL